MRNLRWIAAVGVVGLVLVGCPSGPESKPNKTVASKTISREQVLTGIETGLNSGGSHLKAGMTRAEVVERVGEPDTKQAGGLPAGPFSGPQEGLDTKLLDATRSYEEWRYELKGTVYYLWFGDPKLPAAEWKLVGFASYPKDARF